MLDVMKKVLLTGVGLTLLTKDKVEEVAREIAKSAQLSADKGQAFVDEAVARAEKGRAELDALVQRTVKEALKKTNLPSHDDFTQLSARLEKLEQTLANRSA
jgi:polyhydroxyalkanoate synthesis regulator phasin